MYSKPGSYVLNITFCNIKPALIFLDHSNRFQVVKLYILMSFSLQCFLTANATHGH